MTYNSLYFDATRKNDAVAQERVRAINYLFRMKIVDKSYAKSAGLKTQWAIEEVDLEILEVTPPPAAPMKVEATSPPKETIFEE